MEDKTLEMLEKLNSQLNDMKANMATKEDIANMVTKEDIANMVTKKDIANMVTKEDLNLLADELHLEIQVVLDEVKELRRDLNTMEIMTSKNTLDIAKLKAIR